MIYVIVYFIIGCVIGLVAYRQLKGSKRRMKGSVLSCLLWPIVFGLFVVSVFEDLTEHEEY